MGIGPRKKLGFYKLNELGPGQLGQCRPMWASVGQSGLGVPGPLSQGKGKEQNITHFQQVFSLSTYTFSLLSPSLQPPPLPPELPPPRHCHRTTTTAPESRNLQEVGSGFMRFRVSLHDNGLDCQCGVILGVFAYD